MSLRSFFRERAGSRVVALLVQGLSPEKVALTMAVGVCLASFPVIGATTILCTAAALSLKLNMPLIQAINYLGAPLQIGFLIPLIRLGEALFRSPHLRMPLAKIVSLVTSQPVRAMSLLWTSTLHAIVAWLIVAPVVGVLLYIAFLPLLRTTVRRIASQSKRLEENASAS